MFRFVCNTVRKKLLLFKRINERHVFPKIPQKLHAISMRKTRSKSICVCTNISTCKNNILFLTDKPNYNFKGI